MPAAPLPRHTCPHPPSFPPPFLVIPAPERESAPPPHLRHPSAPYPAHPLPPPSYLLSPPSYPRPSSSYPRLPRVSRRAQHPTPIPPPSPLPSRPSSPSHPPPPSVISPPLSVIPAPERESAPSGLLRPPPGSVAQNLIWSLPLARTGGPNPTPFAPQNPEPPANARSQGGLMRCAANNRRLHSSARCNDGSRAPRPPPTPPTHTAG